MHIAHRKRDFVQFLTYFPFSQLYAKVSIPDIYLIPIQANNAGEGQGFSFQFNDTVTKICRELNARRNTRFRDKCREIEHYSNSVCLVHRATIDF